MDVVTQRLKQLDEEIANATVKAEGAQEAWSTATDPQQKADLKEILQQLQDTMSSYSKRGGLSQQIQA